MQKERRSEREVLPPLGGVAEDEVGVIVRRMGVEGRGLEGGETPAWSEGDEGFDTDVMFASFVSVVS